MYPHHVVIVGGGFGGLYAAKALGDAPVQVTLIDKNNYHLFQPLLYQVAMAGLSPGDVAEPLRHIFRQQKNVRTLLGKVVNLNAEAQTVSLEHGEVGASTIRYDSLIIATGIQYAYFGHEEWAGLAPSLKSVENALEIRRRVLHAYEMAEQEMDPEARQAWLTFAVVGAGPTGMELAGALAEMAHHTLEGEFRSIDPNDTRVVLLEAADQVMPPYKPDSGRRAQRQLEEKGVTVRLNTMVTALADDHITVKPTGGDDEESEQIACHTILWGAGTQGTPLAKTLAERTGVELTKKGTVKVNADWSVGNHRNVFVIGDLGHFAHDPHFEALPGVAQVAIQSGKYVAGVIQKRIQGKATRPFRYFDKGQMATIGRAAAVAEIGPLRFGGFPAWIAWLLVHIVYLVGFGNRIQVFIQWLWMYLNYNRGVRLIIEPERSEAVRMHLNGQASTLATSQQPDTQKETATV